MPRNSSGTYSLYTPGNPVVTSTVISSTWANNTLADLASALTDSLSRTGDGGMQAPLELDDGAVGAPGLTWATETTAGWYRASAGNFRFSVGAADKLVVTSTGLSVAGSIITSTATGGSQGAGTINATAYYDDGVQLTGANPSASIGLTAVNGTAATWMRSDAAPALSQSIAPTWTATHIFTKTGSASTTAPIVINSNTPLIYLKDANGSADRNNARIWMDAGSFNIDFQNDAESQTRSALAIVNNNGVGTMSFGNATDNGAFTFLGTGVITAGGVYRGPNGSASAPTFSFSGDTNTGFYTPSAASDDIYMALGGTGYPVGYRGMPSRTITTSDSTAATDNGRTVLFTGAGSQTFTVDSDFGTASNVMVLLNGGTGSLAVAESLSGTMTWLNGSGALSTGSRTLAIGGIATIWMVDANNAYIWGSGLS